MKQLIGLALLALACGDPMVDEDAECGSEHIFSDDEIGQIEQALGFEPLTFGVYHQAMERQDDLLWMIDCALLRWRVAVGLPLDTSWESVHKLKWAAPTETYSGYTYGSFDTATIKMHPNMVTDDQMCQVMVHEIGHILRRNYGHPCPQYSMSYPSTSIAQSKITQCDVEKVCTVRNCPWEDVEE